MSKKIIDILPPKELEKKEEVSKEEVLEEEVSEKEKPEFKFKITFPQFPFKKSLVLLLFFVLIFLFLLSFRFSKAEIKIWPQVETRNFRTKITVDKTAENPDFNNNILPGKIFEVEKNISEEFPASGRVLKKSEGIIRLYNNFSTQNENWLEGTRFVSSEGKLFKSKDKITVPGAKIENGKMIPSFVDVPVIAAEGGADYNIGPSKFSIVAFRGTPRYTKFYGESSQAMKGGGEVPQVKKEDLENAEKILTEKAKTEIQQALEAKIPTEFLFSKEVFETKILEKNPSVQVGTETEKFSFQVKVKGTTISLLKEDINNFVKEYIQAQIPKDKKLFDKSLKTEYSPESPFSSESDKTTISLNFSAKIYSEVDLDSLRKGLAGKSLAETKIFLENQSDILRTEVRISPFWIRNLPKDIEKIEIKYPFID
jgi:hypothetical protein